MKPIGPLMREHRIIERMLALLDKESKRIAGGNPVNINLIIAAVDFFRTYADRTHHGKEEDILFRESMKKPLPPEYKQRIAELIRDHVTAREIVSRLAEAAGDYGRDNARSLEEIQVCLQELVRLYPAHILKEDQHFFFPVQEYFNRAEQDAMLDEFGEFDRKMIHEKYLKVVEEYEIK
jgi:hemerythrin-like domain-containing protein